MRGRKVNVSSTVDDPFVLTASLVWFKRPHGDASGVAHPKERYPRGWSLDPRPSDLYLRNSLERINGQLSFFKYGFKKSVFVRLPKQRTVRSDRGRYLMRWECAQAFGSSQGSEMRIVLEDSD